MSILSTAIQGFSKGERCHIESLNIDVKVLKMTAGQAKRLQEFQKQKGIDEESLEDTENGLVVFGYILKNFFTDTDGNPLLAEEEYDTLVDDMPVQAIKEFSEAFSKANGIEIEPEELEDSVKKK